MLRYLWDKSGYKTKILSALNPGAIGGVAERPKRGFIVVSGPIQGAVREGRVDASRLGEINPAVLLFLVILGRTEFPAQEHPVVLKQRALRLLECDA